jgi:hypothetical protein
MQQQEDKQPISGKQTSALLALCMLFYFIILKQRGQLLLE